MMRTNYTRYCSFCSTSWVKPPWKVTEVIPDLDEKTIAVRIEWPKGEKGPCPECKQPCQIYDHREER